MQEEFSHLVAEYNLSPREIQFRDKWVEEYLKDFSATKASIRCGYPAPIADEYGQKLLQDKYVLDKIQARKREVPHKDELVFEDAQTKRLIINQLLKEAQYNGPGASHAARVSALARLTQLYGMEAPKVVKNEVTHRGGVMAIPQIADIDEWEQVAVAQQEKLASDAVH